MSFQTPGATNRTDVEDSVEAQGGDGGVRLIHSFLPSKSDATVEPRKSSHRVGSGRSDYMKNLYLKRQARFDILSLLKTPAKPTSRDISTTPPPSHLVSAESETLAVTADASYLREIKEEVEKEDDMKVLSERSRELADLLKDYPDLPLDIHDAPLEVRMEDLTYTVVVDVDSKVETVFNTSCLYPIYKWYKHQFRGEERKVKNWQPKQVLNNISLLFKPGKMYLVLGAPGAGKTTLLRAIAGLLCPAKGETLAGSISYNGRKLEDAEEFFMDNAFGYISQLDKHASRLTVQETFEFAFQCKSGGAIVGDPDSLKTDEAKDAHKRAMKNRLATHLILAALGLTEVKNTFVGDSDVRGVSGGQRRRVTVGEMLMTRAPVLCGDEISTGLDAASTFDMIQMILHFGRMRKFTRIISLLQPSPETVSLFDEVIVMAEGQILFCGPIVEVEHYFSDLGYAAPDYMDVADFLQMVSTDEGATLYNPPEDIKSIRPDPPTIPELAELFRQSKFGNRVKEQLASPPAFVWKEEDSKHGGQVSSLGMTKAVQRKYANSFLSSLLLILKRSLTLWIRDKRVIIAGAVKNILMGVSVGGVFWDTEDPVSIQGALFQALLFVMLGAMQSSTSLVEDRTIFYKHRYANFYSAWPFVFGRAMSQIPQTIMDTLMFGILMYYFIGLGGREEGAAYLLNFLGLLFVFAVLMSQQLAVFASFATTSMMQAYSACIILVMMLFGGFIVAPDSIPRYYDWAYWCNPFAWVYRSLIVLEFRSSIWEDPDTILTELGFVTPNDDPFGDEWVAYGYYLMVPYALACCVLTAVGLSTVRNESGTSAPVAKASEQKEVEGRSERIEISFKPVTLSFHGVSYEVGASTTNETLKLLHDVNGIFRAGRMCALMGSSGAGKTTLMDVIALRKRSGKVTGDVLLNGWPQNRISFRRMSGFVEQFDVQSPQLTVKETILFSARLRLDPALVPGDEAVQTFVDYIMEETELSELAPALVGTDETGGLSFEQKKRLSIAVELAASPSIIFLDEPTSGLDARSALIVVKTLKKIADGGRTICATIHQPSSTVFAMFDDLLLLKKGGYTVYHGELGSSCETLISYFESKGAPAIEVGENPANWMLRVITMESTGDLAEAYRQSEEFRALNEELGRIKDSPNADDEVKYESEFAVSWARRSDLVNWRLQTIYWRSPTYSLAKISVSMVIAFVLGSIFITDFNNSNPTYSEIGMRARLSLIFISFIIVGIMAMISVLPVMTMIRDMYYRHRDAGMYGSGAIGLALGVAEKWFLVISGLLFTLVFLATSHIGVGAFSAKFFAFFTLNIALYSYFGQLFVCLVKPKQTAFILSSVFIGLNNFFSGLIVRPQYMIGTFFALPYYIAPGHFVYEGLVMAIYEYKEGNVTASQGSEFQQYLIDIGKCPDVSSSCTGTLLEYVGFFFGGDFTDNHVVRNAGILAFMLVLARVLTWLALQYIRYA